MLGRNSCEYDIYILPSNMTHLLDIRQYFCDLKQTKTNNVVFSEDTGLMPEHSGEMNITVTTVR